VSPAALATVLYSLSAGDPAALGRRLRLNLLLSLLIGLGANGALWLAGGWVLRLFGQSYATQAQASLGWMALGVFPFALKQHYVAIERIHGRISRTALVMAVGGALEMGLAAVGAQINGLVGLSLGWLAGLCLEALGTAPTVWRHARPRPASKPPAETRP
jgi:Na+-driven multidrug efflux pump